MQNNELTAQHTYALTGKITFWTKIAVFAAVVGYIVYSFRQQQHDWRSVLDSWQAANWTTPTAFFLFLLTPLNWAFEALKWQILAQRVERISFLEACRGVLAGLSMGFVLPSQVGDTAGRLLSLRTDRRWQAIGATLVAGGMQFYVALLFGLVALLLLPALPSGYRWLVYVLLFCVAAGLLLATVRRKLTVVSVGWLKRFENYWLVAAYYTNRELLSAFLAASLRYLTFSVQFGLALHLFDIHLPLRQMASGIGLVYLGKTLIPAFNLLSDLGIREASALFVFGQWQVPAPQILAATLTLWLINILLPVLIGLLAIWQINLKK